MRRLAATVLLGSVALVFPVALGQTADSSDASRVTVSPETGVAGDYGTWTVRYRVGADGLAEGGAIRVQLPDVWHAGERNSARPLQASDPTADHYVATECSGDGVRLKTRVESESERRLIKGRRRGLDGRSERYVFVVRVEVTEGKLEAGDTVSVVYGDTSGGSRGMRAPNITTGKREILLAVDAEGDGDFELHSDRPTLQCRPGPVANLRISGPSSLTVGEPAELRLAFTDRCMNAVEAVEGPVTFSVTHGGAEIERRVELDADRGWASVEFTPTQPGILRIEASAMGRLYGDTSNPMRVSAEPVDRAIYWGDLHSHSHYSWDGVGTRNFEYARNVARLDFYAMTDHSIPPSNGFTHGLADHVWEEYTDRVEQHHEPGRFVTIHAYEASFGNPWGHHNVFFRGEPGPLLAPASVSLPEMWERLKAGEALTIPHHTGKFPGNIEWTPDDPRFRRNFEIYSAHGLSETYNPQHPLAFEQSEFTSPSSSVNGPQFATDAWAAGLRLSTVAASDDHRSQPGKPHWGLTAVKSHELTRPAVFDSLHDRRTYGTTGARILLDFEINGTPMGGEVSVNDPPELRVEAHGTTPIQRIEILRYDEAAGAFRPLYTIRPDTLDVEWSAVDQTFRGDSIYYIRLRESGQIRGHPIMAWSSPIWVQRTD